MINKTLIAKAKQHAEYIHARGREATANLIVQELIPAIQSLEYDLKQCMAKLDKANAECDTARFEADLFANRIKELSAQLLEWVKNDQD